MVHLTRWNPQDAHTSGYWGPVTASIDWCERNYDLPIPLAEPANTLTNIAFIAYSAYGLAMSSRARLSTEISLSWVGMLLVGLGSFAFHATLQYSMQLADELPMIYATTFLLYSAMAAGETSTGNLKWLLAAYDFVVTAVYLYWPNPVFHQVSYALLVACTILRMVKLLRSRLLNTPAEDRKNAAIRRLSWLGILTYGIGFAIWNVDNLFCVPLTRHKERIGYPASFLLEGHAWWHIFTCFGSGYIATAIAMLSACLSPAGHEPFQLIWWMGGLIPHIKRTDDKQRKKRT